MKINIKKLVNILFFSLFFSLLFLVSPASKALAGQCSIHIVFDVNPKSAPFNKPVNLTGSVDFSGSVFNAPGTTDAGYCTYAGDTIKSLEVKFFPIVNINNLGVNLTVPQSAKVLNFSSQFTPSDLNYKAGDSIPFQAAVYEYYFPSATIITQSAVVNLPLAAGIYQSYACVAADGKYACSSHGLSDCSDVPNGACNGKTCVAIADSKQCGQVAPVNGGNTGTGGGGTGGNTGTGGGSGTGGNTGTGGGGTGGNTGTGGNATNNTGTDCVANPNSPNCVYNPIGFSDLPSFMLYIIKWLLGIIGTVAVLMIIIGGFRMVFAQGNEEAFGKARKTITYAIIGLVVSVLSFTIVQIVSNILKAGVHQ